MRANRSVGMRAAERSSETSPRIRSTTVLCVRRDGKVVMAGDGQVTLGEGVIKHTARKIRRLYNDKILAGFAGSTADAFSLFSRFESKLEQYHGNLGRAAVELAKDWRTDKSLRQLEALLLVADQQQKYLISGHGDVIEEPKARIQEYLAHRVDREQQVLGALKTGPQRIPELVELVYRGQQLPPGLVEAAGWQVHAHLLKLKAEGTVTGTSVKSAWKLA